MLPRLWSGCLVYAFPMQCITKDVVELKWQCSRRYRQAHKALTIVVELKPCHVGIGINPPPCLGTSSTCQKFNPATIQWRKLFIKNTCMGIRHTPWLAGPNIDSVRFQGRWITDIPQCYITTYRNSKNSAYNLHFACVCACTNTHTTYHVDNMLPNRFWHGFMVKQFTFEWYALNNDRAHWCKGQHCVPTM